MFRREALEDIGERSVQVGDGSCLSLSQPVLELCEGLLDGIEIGAVGRQEEAVRAGGSNGLSNGLAFVTAEVVENDDVAGCESGDEEPFDIGQEPLAVDWSVEDAGCVDAFDPERGEEGQRPPAAVRGLADQTFAAPPPASQRRHIGLDPGLVDEHQTMRVDTSLSCPPSAAVAGDIGPVLLTGVCGFF